MNIYVGNLATAVTEEDLNNLFSEYGNITSVKIIKDMYTGVSKGFGFVELTGKTEDAVQQLNSKELKGKSIVVNEARPKNNSSSGTRGHRSFSNSGNSRSGRW